MPSIFSFRTVSYTHLDVYKRQASYNNVSNALGYSVYYYARNMYETPGLKFMAVDGVLPDSRSIRDGSYPVSYTHLENVKNIKKQINQIAAIYDWDMEVNTTDPEFYKWTQWIFVKMFKEGLALSLIHI